VLTLLLLRERGIALSKLAVAGSKRTCTVETRSCRGQKDMYCRNSQLQGSEGHVLKKLRVEYGHAAGPSPATKTVKARGGTLSCSISLEHII
jgi:hypothetical protein